MELRANLKQGGKFELLEQTRKISQLANFAYLRQKGPYGTGTPLLNAAHLIGNEPFIYTFADDFVVAQPSRFSQLIEQYGQQNGSVLTCVRRDDDEDYKRYGYVAGNEVRPGLVDVTTIIEKPGSREAAPSNLASVSGYVLEPAVLDYLQKQLEGRPDDAPGEFLLQDALQTMINDGHHVYGLEIASGTYYDTGNPLEYLKTVIDFGLERPDIGPALAEHLRKKLQ
jgi:UTP--glucose-1-phosphate uridylyltransferase